MPLDAFECILQCLELKFLLARFLAYDSNQRHYYVIHFTTFVNVRSRRLTRKVRARLMKGNQPNEISVQEFSNIFDLSEMLENVDLFNGKKVLLEIKCI